MTQMYTTKASSFFNCLVALAVLTVVHSPALCGVVLAPGDPAPPIALSNDQASYTPTVAAASALLKWSPCDYCRNLCNYVAPNASLPSAGGSSPAAEQKIETTTEAAVPSEKEPIAEEVPIAAKSDNWPPPLPGGIPNNSALTVAVISAELNDDEGYDFSRAEERKLRDFFENFSEKYGTENQALVALKETSMRSYIKILVLIHDFLDKYTALDDKGQRFIDNVIAFFKPVIQQELNQPTSAHDFAYAESLDQELQLREATLMYQYMELPVTSWAGLALNFPTLVDEIEDITKWLETDMAHEGGKGSETVETPAVTTPADDDGELPNEIVIESIPAATESTPTKSNKGDGLAMPMPPPPSLRRRSAKAVQVALSTARQHRLRRH